jgi:hypothetical protein
MRLLQAANTLDRHRQKGKTYVVFILKRARRQRHTPTDPVAAAAAAPAAAVRRGNAAAAAAAAHHSASVPSSSVAQLPVRPSCNALMGTACKRRSNLPAAETAASQLDCLLHLNNAVRCVRELGVLQVMLLCY